MKFLPCLLLLFCSTCLSAAQNDSATIDLPVLVRGVRVFGGSDERLPPILLAQQRASTISPAFGERSIQLEIDVAADVPPSLSVQFVHCNVDWQEDDNLFLSDIGTNRTTLIQWTSAPTASRYYTYRGSLSIPNEQVKILYGGNWKAKFLDLTDQSIVLAEARFFAVDCAAECTMEIFTDFYEPTHRVSPTALIMEAVVGKNSSLSNGLLTTAVFYRNHRWSEPHRADQANFGAPSFSNQRTGRRGIVSGLSGVAKRFRSELVPAENEYRILDMTNTAQFPSSTSPVRLPLSDLRRNGSFFQRADDGAMITRFISSVNDEYVPVEFILDPENRFPSEEVFLVGSFNNWTPSTEWQMSFDEENRLFRLRHWIRRARHNYLYLTGKTDADTRRVAGGTYEDFEGNTASAGHTFIGLIYYREVGFGGYDSIVAVGAASVFGPIRR